MNGKDKQPQPGEPIEQQAQQQTGQKQLRLRIDEREMQTSYANAFRANETAEEVMLDFGLNVVRPASDQQEQPEILFKTSHRVILNYYSAKRLAITLSRLVRKHEDQFGELELDVANRRSDKQD